MLNNTAIKRLSGLLAAAMIASAGCAAFADNTDITNPPVTEPAGGDNNPESPDPPEAPKPTPVNISANYFENSKNSYTVVFSSLDALSAMSNFNFVVSFTNAKIDTPKFDASLENGEYSTTIKSGNIAEFTGGASQTPVSGKVVLCSITVTTDGTALSADTIKFSDFKATGENSAEITFEPTLTVKAGPVVPELSETEQKTYDLIAALPSVSELSYYNDDNTMIDIDELSKTVDTASEAYKALTSAQQGNVRAVLTYNMKNADAVTELTPVASAMKNTYSMVEMALTLASAKDEELGQYRFITNVYESIKDSVSASGLPANSAVLSQFEAAKSIIVSKKITVENKFAALDYKDKVSVIASQVPLVQKLSYSKYYSQYLTDLLKQANGLRKDIEDNCTDSYKKYYLQDLDENISKIEMIQNGVSSLPSFDVEDITLGSQYTVTLTRASSAANAEADVKIVVNDSKDKNEIDTNSYKFESGSRKLEAKKLALRSVYPRNENVIVHVYYTVSGAEFYLGSKTVKCRSVASSVSTTGGISTGNNSSSNNNSGISGGTKYPSGKDDNSNSNKDNNDDKTELFGDIAKYDWAKEAIEGLYYAGIVNGMEKNVFNPAGEVTREQFCKMVVQLFGIQGTETESGFADADKNAWYAPFINSAIRAGYVQGQSDEYFGIGESIMRQDMVTILYRALGSKNSGAVLNFTDNDSIAEYAKDAVSELVGLGVINGYEDGSFKPRGTATRAEAAKVIWGVYNIIND